MREEVELKHQDQGQLHGAHETDGDPSEFGLKILFEIDPVGCTEEGDRDCTAGKDQDPLEPLERQQAADDTADQERREAVSVASDARDDTHGSL